MMISDMPEHRKLQSAYENMTESARKRLFEEVKRHTGFKEWSQQLMALPGFQNFKKKNLIAQRPPQLRGCIDKAILDPQNKRLIGLLVSLLFLPDDETESFSGKCFTKAELFHWIDDKWDGVFTDLSRAFFSPAILAEFEIRDDPPPIAEIGRLWKNMLKCAENLGEVAFSMRQSCDIPELRLSTILSEYQLRRSEFLEMLEVGAKVANLSIPDFTNNTVFLEDFLDILSDKLRKQYEENNRHRNFFLELAKAIEELHVRHRSPRHRERLKNDAATLCKDLRERAEDEASQISWPFETTSAKQWLKKVLQFEDERLMEVSEALRAETLDALADFIEEGGPHWLSETDPGAHKASVKTKVMSTNSADEERLEMRLREATNQIEQLKKQVQISQESRELKNCELQHLKRQLDAEHDRIRSEEETLHKMQMALRAAGNEIAENPDKSEPESVREVLAEAARIYDEQFIFAFNSKSEDKDSLYKRPGEVKKILNWLATTYYRARTGEKPCHDLHLDVRRTVPGWFYSSHQSELTTGRWKEWYQCSWNKQTWTIEEHLGSGTNKEPTTCIRIGFTWLPKHKRVLIGFLGQHQQNTKS